MEEQSLSDAINDLILDLSLATFLPIGTGENKQKNYIAAAAAASAIAEKTKNISLQELKAIDWIIKPLVEVLQLDIEHPMAAKSSLALRNLMRSRQCMLTFLGNNCLPVTARVMDMLLSKRSSDLKRPCDARSVVENIAACYRELAQFYPWELVNTGAIRHCVTLLKLGDVPLQTIVSTTMASLSNDLEICKQMFTYGAIRPLLTASDVSNTNEACMLAGLGCITQLCRIPEIGLRVAQQGAVPLLEKGLLLYKGHGNLAIREKSLYALSFLSRVHEIRDMLITPKIIRGLSAEFAAGSLASREVIIRLLMNVHRRYEGEKELVDTLKDPLLELIRTGPWSAKNLCLKAVCVLFDSNEYREYFVEKGLVDSILKVMSAKGEDLQEVPIVTLLYLSVHPTIPTHLLQKGVDVVAAELLNCHDHIIRELCVILLKALALHDSEAVEKVVPAEKKYLFVKDIRNPQLYGGEYGGLVQDYLQTIVGNRHDQNYLRDILTEQDMLDLQLTEEELVSYENTFLELDADCGGTLDIDELKLLMVLMGEKMDQYELQELLEEYDTDHSGSLDFKEFVVMMKGWKTRFGTGVTKAYNETVKRGHIGKAAREFFRWWNKSKLEAAQVQEAKESRARAMQSNVELQMRYLDHENLRYRRKQEADLRKRGVSVSDTYRNNPVTSKRFNNASSLHSVQSAGGNSSKGWGSVTKLPSIS